MVKGFLHLFCFRDSIVLTIGISLIFKILFSDFFLNNLSNFRINYAFREESANFRRRAEGEGGRAEKASCQVSGR